MKDNATRWFYRSIWLILAGLVVELVSLFGLHHPLGFMFFAIFGLTLTGAGILIFVYYMLSLVRPSGSRSSE
jgi:hypothetical protein